MFSRPFRYFTVISLVIIGLSHAASNPSIPFSQLGAEATKKSGNKGLSVTELWNGYRLECQMQDLQAEVTMSGAIIRSTSESEGRGAFSIRAERVGRGKAMKEIPAATDWVNANNGVIRSRRGSIVEEYTTSGDGIRQDFVISSRPRGKGKLLLELAIEGAEVKSGGTDGSVEIRVIGGRILVYHALNVIDAAGKTLEARFEKAGERGIGVTIEDNGAKYPVCIDPTITDADWVSMVGVPGVDGGVSALAIDRSGNLFAAGTFSVAGDVAANNIAKWNGSVWSNLGSGINRTVYSLSVDGAGNLYAGGWFDTAGDITANNIAKWDGNAWSALGSGTNDEVFALAADDSGNLFAGGSFDTAGGIAANNIAKWDGSRWNALGSGIKCHFHCYTLAVDGSGNLYAAGLFDTAGNVPASNIAKWDGTEWSALGSGVHPFEVVYPAIGALSIDNAGNLYAGGYFDTAGGIAANNIAKWDGHAWSALGSGISPVDLDGPTGISALSLDSEGNLYAGGGFDKAGGTAAHYLAKWDGSQWSALGSGTNDCVYALAVDGSNNLYAGGSFNIAGGKVSASIAQCKLNGLPVQPRMTGTPSRPPISYDSRSGLIRLSVQSPATIAYRVFTLSGREVFRNTEFITKGNHSFRINRANLSRGVYIAHVDAGKESMRFRMAVER